MSDDRPAIVVDLTCGDDRWGKAEVRIPYCPACGSTTQSEGRFICGCDPLRDECSHPDRTEDRLCVNCPRAMEFRCTCTFEHECEAHRA